MELGENKKQMDDLLKTFFEVMQVKASGVVFDRCWKLKEIAALEVAQRIKHWILKHEVPS